MSPSVVELNKNQLVRRCFGCQFYNGWTHGHYVSNVFVFAPDGKIIGCVVNPSGSFRDSTMSDYEIYQKLEKLYNEFGAKTVADSAFIVTSPYLILSGDDHTDTTEQELL
jgi:DDE superfamily endonuclease